MPQNKELLPRPYYLNMVCFTKQSKNNVWGDIFVLFVLPLMCYLVRIQYILYTTSTPPTDYGSGAMFDKIAPRYDMINRFLSLNLDTSWRAFMVQEVLKDFDLLENDGMNTNKEDVNTIKILDLATGTADVALSLAKEIQAKAQNINVSILGVDPSANMIDIGNKKIQRYLEKSGNSIELKLQLGDARDLSEFEDSIFHRVTMAFGIRNVPERETALCEIHRVLVKAKEGTKKHSGNYGKLAILEFSEPADQVGVLGFVARFFIHNVVPLVGATLSGAPKEYVHLQNSIEEFPSPPEFVKLIEGIECSAGKRKKIGKFRLDDLHHINLGTVQLYLATPYYK